jgi:hypothetical protein
MLEPSLMKKNKNNANKQNWVPSKMMPYQVPKYKKNPHEVRKEGKSHGNPPPPPPPSQKRMLTRRLGSFHHSQLASQVFEPLLCEGLGDCQWTILHCNNLIMYEPICCHLSPVYPSTPNKLPTRRKWNQLPSLILDEGVITQ